MGSRCWLIKSIGFGKHKLGNYLEEDIAHIIRGCIANDRRSQELLYKSYYRSMMSLCLRYTKNNEDALEVLNSGFLKVFRSISRFDATQASLYTWIRTIVINTCLDHIRKHKDRRPMTELSNAAEPAEADEILNKLHADHILACIRTLPEVHQAVFNLFVVEGYGHREIAAALEINESTCRWYLSEARKQLQNKIMELNKVHG